MLSLTATWMNENSLEIRRSGLCNGQNCCFSYAASTAVLRDTWCSASEMTSAEYDFGSVFGIFGITSILLESFCTPQTLQQVLELKEKSDSVGLQRERSLGHGYSAVISTNDTSTQEQNKKNCRTKTEPGGRATGNRMWSHFLRGGKKLFWRALSCLQVLNVNSAFL